MNQVVGFRAKEPMAATWPFLPPECERVENHSVVSAVFLGVWHSLSVTLCSHSTAHIRRWTCDDVMIWGKATGDMRSKADGGCR